MDIIAKILSILWGVIRHFTQFDRTTQNHYNKGEESESTAKTIPIEDALDSTRIAQNAPVKILPSYRWPVTVAVHITSPFGYRNLQGVGMQFHPGIDLVTEWQDYTKMDVVAPEDCIIQKILKPDYANPSVFGWSATHGWQAITAPAGKTWNDGSYAWTPYLIAIGIHSKTKYVFYHVDPCVEAGESVRVGNFIGNAGNWGFSQGEHLHFETWEFNEKIQGYDNPTDPEAYMKKMLKSEAVLS